jgi:hypothetical protein
MHAHALIPSATEANPKRRLCRHCKTRTMRYARDLCTRCWKNLVIRDLYPPGPHETSARVRARNERLRSRRNVSCHENAGQEIALPAFTGDPSEPTDAIPGSPEKVAVLAKRFDVYLPLFHQDDRVITEADCFSALRHALQTNDTPRLRLCAEAETAAILSTPEARGETA